MSYCRTKLVEFNSEKDAAHISEIINKTDLIIQITPTIVKDNYTNIEKKDIHSNTEAVFMNNSSDNKNSQK